MKTLQITTKAKAYSEHEGSIYTNATPWGTLKQERYDMGHYKWQGTAKAYEGTEVDAIDGVVALWMERKTDSSGPYAALYCLAHAA